MVLVSEAGALRVVERDAQPKNEIGDLIKGHDYCLD
jgi:hypothetical protein